MDENIEPIEFTSNFDYGPIEAIKSFRVLVSKAIGIPSSMLLGEKITLSIEESTDGSVSKFLNMWKAFINWDIIELNMRVLERRNWRRIKREKRKYYKEHGLVICGR